MICSKVKAFYRLGGFCKLVEFHRVGSVTNGATLSSSIKCHVMGHIETLSFSPSLPGMSSYFSPPMFSARGSASRAGALESPARPFSIDKQIPETRMKELRLNDLVLKKLRLKAFLLKKLRLKALTLEKQRKKGHSCKK